MKREIPKDLQAPALTGYSLVVFSWIIYFIKPLGRFIVQQSNIFSLRGQDFKEIQPILQPLHSNASSLEIKSTISCPVDYKSINDFSFPSSLDFVHAYTNDIITPSKVLENVLNSIEASKDSISAFLVNENTTEIDNIRKEALESTDRYKRKCPLSLLDGVPIAVKDEMDVRGWKTLVGTSAFNDTLVKANDCEAIHRLRQMGALIIGKTCMQELGLDTTGNNPIAGTPKNPYALNHYPGGSSSGSAAAVACGICPVAIGIDGGGSIRIPASYCGLFGLKPTFGRVSTTGAFPSANTVGHIGPLAANAIDMAISYSIMAGKDECDRNSQTQPLDSFDIANISEIPNTIRIANDEISITCKQSLDKFISIMAEKGCKIELVPIEILGLESMRIAHTISIVSEITTCLNHYPVQNFGSAARIAFITSKHLSAEDYLQAQKVRSEAMDQMQHIFKSVDLIVTPSTACLAPVIRPSALSMGESDLKTTSASMRFAYIGNLTGIPCASFPCGYSSVQNLPIGIQFMSTWWNEELILKLAIQWDDMICKKKPACFWKVT